MRDGKKTKIPKSPVDGTNMASTADPETWAKFSDAINAYQSEGYDGIGFVFTEEGDFVGVDLDDCRDPETGEFDDWAIDVMETLESFTEISPSGTGAHVIVEGEMPDGRKRRGDLEMYEDGRFFTVTGDVVSCQGHSIDDPVPISERTDELAAVAEEYLYKDDEDEQSRTVEIDVDEIDIDPEAVDDSKSGSGELNGLPEEDAERLKEMFRRKREAYELWRGSTAGYPSHSEADQALCNHLAYWLDRNARRIDRAFRRSQLYRQKWDDVHYSDGSTYGEGTIEEAVKATSSAYSTDRETETETETEGGEMGTDNSGTDESESPKESRDGQQDSPRENTPGATHRTEETQTSGDSTTAEENTSRRRGRGQVRERGQRRRTRNDSKQSGVTSQTEQGQSSPAPENRPQTESQASDEEKSEPDDQHTRRRGRSQVDAFTDTGPTTDDDGSHSREGSHGTRTRDGKKATGRTTQSASQGDSIAQGADLNIPNPDEIDSTGTGGGGTSRERDRRGRGSTTRQEKNGQDAGRGFDVFGENQGQEEDRRGRGSQTQSVSSQEGSQNQQSEHRQSRNGKREIPSATDERIREFGFKIDELEEEIGRVEKELKNEHDLVNNNIEETLDELRHYEDVVDELDGKVTVLTLLLESLCKQLETPVAREIATIVRDLPADPDEVPEHLREDGFMSGTASTMKSPGESRSRRSAQERRDTDEDELEAGADDAESADEGFIHALKNLGGRS